MTSQQTPVLSLPFIQPSQAQKHVTHNEALRILDVAVQLAVINRTTPEPPSAPALGDRYLVPEVARGDWAARTGQVALWSGDGWEFTKALPGWRARVLDEGFDLIFDGVRWVVPDMHADAMSVSRLGVNAGADSTNRLSVRAPATLFNHEGQGHQVKVNKAELGDTASLVFQTGYSGRAELGLIGTDNFSLKVSANGADFQPALTASATSGEVTFPRPIILHPQAADPVAPAEGAVWLNGASEQMRVRVGAQTRVIDTQTHIPYLIPASGEYILPISGSNSAGLTTVSIPAGGLDLFPFAARANTRIDGISVNISAGVANGTGRFVIYGSDPLGRPDQLLRETPDVDLSASGIKTGAADLKLLQGQTYWLGLRLNVGMSLPAWAPTATPDINGGSPQLVHRKTLRRAWRYEAAAPSSWAFTSDEIAGSAAPVLWLRVG